MTNWSSPEEMIKAADIMVKLIHTLLGVYAYEWLLSIDFEFDLLRGKKKFRWPLIVYLANRYLLLFSLIGIVISLNATTKIDCQALFTFNQVSGDAAVGLASINLSIRTMAIWGQNRYITGFLVMLILGQWSLILQGIQLTAIWVPSQGCVITETHNYIIAVFFAYSMCFDLTVLLLNTYKLAGARSPSQNILGRNHLAKLIFTDGLIYFILAFMVNLLATVFMMLNLNPVMSVISNVPAAVISTIAACRAVRRLAFFTQGEPDAGLKLGQHHLNIHGASMAATGTASRASPLTGVELQMETFNGAKGGMNADDFASQVKRTSWYA